MDKKDVEITFTYRGHRHKASASVIRHPDHVQYTVSDKDESVFTKYGALVFHKFHAHELQAAFPGLTPDARSYGEAVGKALAHQLKSRDH